jgi:hypothetical protein
MTAEGKALKRPSVGSEGAVEGKPLEGDVALLITLYFGTKRRADIDNFNKLSLDALTSIVYEDDSQIAELTLTRAYDKARPQNRKYEGLPCAGVSRRHRPPSFFPRT